jgi:AraC-like DNA-binding protein
VNAYTKARGSDWVFPIGSRASDSFRGLPAPPGSFRLVLLERGAGILAHSGGRALVESPAALCLTDRDGPRMEGEEGCAYRAVVFDPAVVNEAFGRRDPFSEEQFDGDQRLDRFYLHPFLEGRPLFPGKVPLNPLAAGRLAALVDKAGEQLEAQPDRYWPCRGRSFLLESLFLVRRAYDGLEAATGGEEPAGLELDAEPREMEDVVLYLHVHYAEKLSVEGLAAAFGTNRTSLMQKFKRRTGLTINEYVVKLRVRFAGVLLRDTGIPIGEIASRAGFADATHFGRTFRRVSGESPSAYRARLNWVARRPA